MARVVRKVKESEIQRSILDYLQLKKIVAWKNSNVGIYKQKTGQYIPSGTPGVSDILGVVSPSGRMLALEVKVPGRKPTEAQLMFLKKIADAGGIAGVVYSIEDVEDVLSGKK